MVEPDAMDGASPVREWSGVDPDRFAGEILPLGQPAVLRGAAGDMRANPRNRSSIT